MENNTGKYLKYAIGEIILVVIGILIAVQINSWNNTRKAAIRKLEYINTLIEDLKKDSIVLSKQNEYMQKDLDKIIGISERLSQPEANMDTVKKIYNFEFTGRYDPTISLNKNTYDIIISTGEITLFDNAFKNTFLSFYQIQKSRVQIIQENNKLYLDKYKLLNLPPRKQVGMSGNGTFGIKGHFRKQLLKRFKDEEFLNEFSKFITDKAIMEENIISTKKDLIRRTSNFLNYLYKIRED